MSRKDQNHYRSFDQGRKNGWGIGLYRHPSDGWFGGVCAGLAGIGKYRPGSPASRHLRSSYSQDPLSSGFTSRHGY